MTNEKRIPLVAEERNEIGEQVPLALGEGESSAISIHSHLLRAGECAGLNQISVRCKNNDLRCHGTHHKYDAYMARRPAGRTGTDVARVPKQDSHRQPDGYRNGFTHRHSYRRSVPHDRAENGCMNSRWKSWWEKQPSSRSLESVPSVVPISKDSTGHRLSAFSSRQIILRIGGTENFTKSSFTSTPAAPNFSWNAV